MSQEREKRERDKYPQDAFVIRSIEGSTGAYSERSRRDGTRAGIREAFVKKASDISKQKSKK